MSALKDQIDTAIHWLTGANRYSAKMILRWMSGVELSTLRAIAIELIKREWF